MLFNENRIGKISIDDNVTKNILTKYISKLNNGELINIDIKADQNEVFFFYFKYAQNMTSSFLTDTWSLSETIKKFIKKNFGINHTVVVIELGY